MPARRRLALVLFAATAAAASAATTGVQAADGANLPPRGNQSFGWRVQELPVARDYGEPTIVTAHGLTVVDTFGPTVWASANHGKSWVLTTPAKMGAEDCPSGDADHVILADKTILADNLCLAGPTNLIYKSTDGGVTWRPAGPAGALPAEAGFNSDRQWLAAHPTDPKIVYMSYHDLGGPNIWVAKSTDGGATFPQRVPVTAFTPAAFGEAGAGNTTARPIFDPRDPQTLYVAYAYSDTVSGATSPPDEPDFLLRKIGIAKTTDGGLTWKNVVGYDGTQQKARVGHPFTTMAADPAGNLYIAMSTRFEPSKSTAIYVIRSTDKGETWSPPFQVSERVNGSNVMPSIAAPARGVVDVAYYATRVGDFDSRDGDWAVVFSQSRNALAARPTWRHSRVGPQAHTRDICLAGTLCAVTGGNRNLADFIGLTTDAKGLAQIVWTSDYESRGVTMYAEQTRQPR